MLRLALIINGKVKTYKDCLTKVICNLEGIVHLVLELQRLNFTTRGGQSDFLAIVSEFC